MYNEGILISIDPGDFGALTVFKDSKRIKTIDFDIIEYLKIFKEYKKGVIAIETVNPFPGRINQFGSLKESIGEIKGLAKSTGDFLIINEGLGPSQWKRPYGLVKPKDEKWKEYEEKTRTINKCKELYPDIDIPFIRTVHHKDGTTTDYYKDGRADSCMIGDFVLNYYSPKPSKKLNKSSKKPSKKKNKK